MAEVMKQTEDFPEKSAALENENRAESDWIGDLKDQFHAFREDMANVAREADEGMIDGPLGKVFVFLKRYWAVILLAIIPFVPKMAEYWADTNPFPAIPQIITEAELQEISDYIVDWSNAYEYAMNWTLHIDRDDDGERDIRVHAFDCEEPERTKLYVHTSLELPTVWRLITGQCGFAPQGEEMAFQDGQACLIITVSGETKGDRSELRLAVEETLEAVRQEKEEQEAGTYIPPSKPYLQDLMDLILDNQQDNE